MKKAFYFNIADHLILLETPDKNIPPELLQNYLHFLTEKKGNEECLFSFSGDTKIIVPDVSSQDTLEWFNIYSKVFVIENHITISMKIGEVEHRLSATPDWKQIISDITFTDISEKDFLNQFLMTAYGVASAKHKTLKIHASVIEKNGKALLFLGESGTGKSTHSRLWLEHVPGCSLLNDDEPVVRVLEDGSVRVYGTPWSGKTPCYRNISAEVVAFVHLYQSPANKLSKLNSFEALSSLYTSTSVLRCDGENKALLFDTIADILQKTPVYRLDCLPDKEAVSLTESLLRNSQ